jgi:phytol kinase
VAFWPFFLSWHQIQFLSLAFLAVVAVSKYLNIFQAIHSVQRPTWGEFCFAGAVGLVTLVTQNKFIYAAALLQMALADGLAAVVGVRYGNKQKYLIFGRTKSLAGTLTFFVASVLILVGFSRWSGMPLSLGFALLVSVLASLLESLAVRGFDNLLVPILVALLLVNR